MPYLYRSMRSMRYRLLGWLHNVSCINTATVILVFVFIFLVVTVQKLEETYSLNEVSSILPIATPPHTKSPVKLRSTTTTTLKPDSVTLVLKRSKNGSVTSNKGLRIPSPKFMPAIKVYYHPKNSRYQQLREFRMAHTQPDTTKGKTPKVSLANILTVKTMEAIASIYKKSTKAGHVKSTMVTNHLNKNFSPLVAKGREKREPRILFDQWLQANYVGEKYKFLVYSAYWDDRFDAAENVRVMAIMVTKKSPQVYCRLLMSDGSKIEAKVLKKIMNEHWRLTYASYIVSCEVPKGTSPPTKVSISSDEKHHHAAILPVRINKNDALSPRGNLAVCVKPLHYYYDRAAWLVEFVEFHRLLGVDHFFFYNHTVGHNIQAVLKSYWGQGLASIMPWQLNIRSQKEIRTEGIFSSLNDCLFRTMHLFKYVIMLDFDEYIVPRDHDTYPDMIRQLEEDHKSIRGRPGSFVFRNTFFYLYWENDTTVYGVEPEKPPDYIPYLLTQYKTRRLTSSMKPGSRSKYIVIPDRALEVGNHVVWRHTSGSRSIHVPDAMALLHHYRICEFGGYACLKKTSVVDPVAQRFGPALLERVKHQCDLSFRSENGNCPLSPPLGSPW